MLYFHKSDIDEQGIYKEENTTLYHFTILFHFIQETQLTQTISKTASFQFLTFLVFFDAKLSIIHLMKSAQQLYGSY